MCQLTLPAACILPLVLLMVGSSAQAVVITVPPDLAPGAQYRFVFVTSTTHDGRSSNIAGYNAFVDTLGDTVLPSNWTAIASTQAVSARVNTSTSLFVSSGFPTYGLDGLRNADDYASLWNTSVQPLQHQSR